MKKSLMEHYGIKCKITQHFPIDFRKAKKKKIETLEGNFHVAIAKRDSIHFSSNDFFSAIILGNFSSLFRL